MEGTLDFLIDLDSPVPTNQRTSLVPAMTACQKNTSAFPDFMEPSPPEENNPFDLVARQTEMNEADRNDPFEIAFERACGYQVTSDDLLDTSKDSVVKPTEVLSEKPPEVSMESQVLEECISRDSEPLEDVNLDEIQPPEFLVNSSFDLSDNDSININDTLHLSSMSDLKLTPGERKCSLFLEEHCTGDDFFSGKSNSAASLNRKSSVKSETPKRVLSPINFPPDPLTLSEKSSSFEESPIKALCELQSEESVKTLIESRIKKCIAKALNDSHQQFRNSILLEAGETSFAAHQAKPPKGNLRASLSVPQNLHLLHENESCTKPQQSGDAFVLSPVKQKLFEDLTIPVLDHKAQATRQSFNKSFGIMPSFTSESSGVMSTEIQLKVELTSVEKNKKMSEYRDIIEAQLHKIGQNDARSSPEIETEVKPPTPTKGTSPPKLPPLPLSSDTIRDLSLCSKYSPPKSKHRSPGNITTKVTKALVALPVCAQPKLVLRKKTSTAHNNGPVTTTGTLRGPMKAVVPLRNMTRFTGSPRPSAQSQNRRGPVSLSRQSSVDSPNIQKSKLCPLAASTPSNLTVFDKAGPMRAPPGITAPLSRRTVSNRIPSPSRRASNASQISTNANPKADTPTRRSSVSTFGRNANPRVLLDKNGLTSPTITPIRKPALQTAALNLLPKSNPHNLGKENLACP